MLFICILFLLYLVVKHLYFYILYIPKHTRGFIEVTGLETQKEPSDLYLHSQTILYTLNIIKVLVVYIRIVGSLNMYARNCSMKRFAVLIFVVF